MTAAVDAVIFDWGGTLTAWHDIDFHAESFALAQAVVNAEHDLEVSRERLHRAGATIWGRSRDHQQSATVDDLFTEAGLSHDPELLVHYREFWEPHTSTDAQVAPLFTTLRERNDFRDPQRAVPLFQALRAKGIRFALDDHGSSYSHLSLIDQVRPSFIKISNTFGTNLEEDDTHRLIVAHMRSFARDFGCRTVLEGIESEGTASVAAYFGVELAQGYHFGRPQFASHWSSHWSREEVHS